VGTFQLSDIPHLFWEIFQHHRKLQVTITDVFLAGSHEGLCLIMLYISFLNQSNRTLSVFQLKYDLPPQMPAPISLQPLSVAENGNPIYELPAMTEISNEFPLDELMQFPLDIPANQSLGKWTPLQINADNEIRHKLPFRLDINAIDASDTQKVLGKGHKNILIYTAEDRELHIRLSD
jgi:hypothetical protein